MTEKTHPPGRGHGLHPFQTWGQAPVNARKGRHHQEHFHHAAASHYHIAFGGPGFAGPAMGGVFPRQHPTFTYAVPGVYGPYHRPILAERFKTKMCANWTETGACPYFFRCMFAHGEHEMRTKQMNIADGLFTEEAIKAFKRAAYESSLRYGFTGSPHPSPPPPDYHETTTSLLFQHAPPSAAVASETPAPQPEPALAIASVPDASLLALPVSGRLVASVDDTVPVVSDSALCDVAAGSVVLPPTPPKTPVTATDLASSAAPWRGPPSPEPCDGATSPPPIGTPPSVAESGSVDPQCQSPTSPTGKGRFRHDPYGRTPARIADGSTGSDDDPCSEQTKQKLPDDGAAADSASAPSARKLPHS